jgi:hypothetical protein
MPKEVVPAAYQNSQHRRWYLRDTEEMEGRSIELETMWLISALGMRKSNLFSKWMPKNIKTIKAFITIIEY